MTHSSIHMVSSRGSDGYSYSITHQEPDGFGFRWHVEYGHGYDYEGRLIIDTNPRGDLKWEPHREIPNYKPGWPDGSQELRDALTTEIRRRLNGGWRRA